ncbi:MAG: toll/interleukin-1 receptor domain-containing protein [Steroidobacteraceae bacterium]
MSAQSIYLSHTVADTAVVDRLRREIVNAGFVMAINHHTVPPGQPFETALRNAVNEAARFIVCFSSRDGAPTGYDATELLMALERLGTSSAGEDCWLIPVKLTRCDLPALPVGTRTLRELASIDLYIDWEAGVTRLLAALPHRSDVSIAPTAMSSATPRFGVKADSIQATTLTGINVDGHATNPSGQTSIEVGQLTADTLSLTNIRGKR